MASPSSQENVGSRRGKVTTIIPERSRVPPRRRLGAKRQTTLRAFTFVRDWDVRQSPLALVHGQSADKPDDAASSSRSSVTISPSPRVISQTSSGRPRVSPSPIIIASPSSRTRSGTAQKRPPSSHHSVRHGSASVSAGGPRMVQSGDSIQNSSTVGASTVPTPTGPSATSTPADLSIEGTVSQTQLTGDNSLTPMTSQSSSVADDRSVGDHSGPTVTPSPAPRESPGPVAGSILAADPAAVDSPSASSSQSQPVSSSPAVSIQSSGQRPLETPNVRWRVDEGRFTTPAEKSMSIIAKTPKSGPVARPVASRRRKLSPPPEGDRQQSIIAPGAKKAKVRLWAGNGRRRLATDVTDLDLALSTLEEVTMDYKQKLESASQRRALTKFFYLMKKELTDKIDLSQEYKVLKSALTRMTATTRKQRKKLLVLQQENARLNSRIRELKNNAMNKKDKSQEMVEISTFLSDLQQFHRDSAESMAGEKDGNQTEFSSQNIGPLLADAQASSRSAYNLRSMNNKLQEWLDTH
ncbi:centromere protein U-like [Patiria miniata]|uniref:Centromere protein U n=1 Tax=Patiria miniata TaxID=46514 RepID=A0A914ADX4_PATMI|nr:centromere protein U-like [Patiria miniata]